MDDTEPLIKNNSDKKVSIEIPSQELQKIVYANNDRLIHFIEKEIGVSVAGRGEKINITGDEVGVAVAKKIFENIFEIGKKKGEVSEKELTYLVNRVKKDANFNVGDFQNKFITIGHNGKVISPKSIGQAKYFDAVMKNDINFVIGPAGTGKTYIAMAFALHYLFAENISRIILTRPVVEAGESLGFLPGDLEQKINPYLRPLYDAIYDMIPYPVFQRYVERGAIEIAPLAYMRGRTLHDAFIILDEAQNTTKGQILMFLTRIGYNSKTIITGDITQIDLPKSTESGLIAASRVLKGIKGISFVYLGPEDVVRHPLVEEIIRAFDRDRGDEIDRR
ncbi:MAG: phosphate starvation-inducible protein PhoH [Spirochaetes bacterium]|nr:MAG: phosphate starvation-inducible protein PhoH [Spirochaetota bacterium]